MSAALLRFAVALVRAWTRLYTWRIPPDLRDERRAEIDSDLWEFQHDEDASAGIGAAAHLIARLLTGAPDDLGWTVDQAAVAGTFAQGSIAFGGRVAGAVLVICALWAIDADASRRRPDISVAGPAAVFDQNIKESATMRAGDTTRSSGRSTTLLAAGIAAAVGASMQLAAQSPPAAAASGPVFEVVSIKPNPTGGTGPTRSGVQPGGRFVAENIPVRLLIGQAYEVPSYRLVGGPSWITSESFDIDAKANGELSARGGLRPLDGALQGLLVDRFKLVVHTETRQLPIYTLAMARSDGRLGPNLTRSSITDCAPVLAAVLAVPGGGPSPPGGGGPPPSAPGGQAPPCSVMTGNGRFSANSRSLPQLAGIISAMVDRRVVDQTGLTGLFNAQLTWTPDQMPQQLNPNAPPIDPNGPSLFTAVQDQLGLKLESTSGPVDVLVIDSVEKPAPN